MPELKQTVDDRYPNRALHAVERHLDSAALRLAGRVWSAVQARRRRSLAGVREGTVSDVLKDRSVPPVQVAHALRSALSAGALESAATLVDRLLPQLLSLPSTDRAPAVITAAEALLMLGRYEGAAELAEAHPHELADSAAGIAVGELLEIPGGARLPQGRPNLLGLSRRVAKGGSSAADVARLLDLTARDWLRTPEVALLFFSALVGAQPERALRFLNWFLELHGLDCALAVNSAQSGGGFLARLEVQSNNPCARGPLVSIVVPVHNGGTTLGYALESLLGQSYQTLEVLVGDDASEDETIAVMRRYAGDARVRLFRSERNQGAYNVRNALVTRARGEFVTFHDADDWALPVRIERQVRCLERTGAVGCVANHVRVRPDGPVVFFKDQRATRLSRVSLMLRRDAFAAFGPFRSALIGADEELHAKIHAQLGSAALVRIAAPLTFSLWSPSSATRTPGKEALENGYRSPSRRAYSELVFRRYVAREPIEEDALEARLRETDNYAVPSQMRELTELSFRER